MIKSRSWLFDDWRAIVFIREENLKKFVEVLILDASQFLLDMNLLGPQLLSHLLSPMLFLLNAALFQLLLHQPSVVAILLLLIDLLLLLQHLVHIAPALSLHVSQVARVQHLLSDNTSTENEKWQKRQWGAELNVTS